MHSQHDNASHDQQADGIASWHLPVGGHGRAIRRHRFEPPQIPRSEQAVSQADGVA
jgi:hypothetical protein